MSAKSHEAGLPSAVVFFSSDLFLSFFFALSSSPFLLLRPFSSSSLCSLTPDTNQTRKNAQDAAAARNRGFRPQLTYGITL